MSDAKIAVKVQVLLSGRAPHYRRLVATTFTDVREAITRMYHRDAGDLIFEYRDEENDLVQFDTEFEWEAIVTQQQQTRTLGGGLQSLDASTSGSGIVRIVVRSTDMEGPALLAAQQALACMSSVAPSMSGFFDAADVSAVVPSLSAAHHAAPHATTPALSSRSPSAAVISAPAQSPATASAASAPQTAPSAEARPAAVAGFTKRCPMCQSQLQLHASPLWRCDLCNHRAARDGTETSLACRRCNFDLCLDCNNRLDVASASGDATVPPPPLARAAGAGQRWAASPVGALLQTMRDLVVGGHSHRQGAAGRDDSSVDETPVLPTLDAATQPEATATQDATTQGATITADATTQGSAATVDATTHAPAPVTTDATTQQGAATVTADATTQRASDAAAATTHAGTTMTADATTVTTVEPAVSADSATETGDHLVTPPTAEHPAAAAADETLEAARDARLVLSPTLRTALRDLIPLLSLVYNTDAQRAIISCDAARFRGAVRIQCNTGAGTVAYTLQDDLFVEHAFARMVELVRLASAAPGAATQAPPTPSLASASESVDAAALAAASAVPVPDHPLATAEEIASGLCNFYPALPTAHYNYAIILVKRNQTSQALTQLETAVHLGISPAVAHSDADLALLHREVRFRLLGAAPAAPEVKALLELFGDLSAADARAALARYGSVHRAADALLASDGVLPAEPAATQPAGLGPYQGPVHGQNHAPAAPPPRPSGFGFHPLSGLPSFGSGRR